MRAPDRRTRHTRCLPGSAGLLLGALLLHPAAPAAAAETRSPQPSKAANLQGTWRYNADLTARLNKGQQDREAEEAGGTGDRPAKSQGLGNMGPIGGGDSDPLGLANPSAGKDRHDGEKRREVTAFLDALTITQQSGQVTITDQSGHARVLKTDGSKVRDQGPAGPAQLRASWDRDGSLVIEVRPDKGTRRTESYLVSNDGKHLYLTIAIAGQRSEILRAYDPGPAGAAPAAAVAPATGAAPAPGAAAPGAAPATTAPPPVPRGAAAAWPAPMPEKPPLEPARR